jgi:hypothetical protein
VLKLLLLLLKRLFFLFATMMRSVCPCLLRKSAKVARVMQLLLFIQFPPPESSQQKETHFGNQFAFLQTNSLLSTGQGKITFSPNKNMSKSTARKIC